MSSTSPETSGRSELRVVANAEAELFVIDSRLRLVMRGVGSLSSVLPNGVYKLKARLGREETEQIILHQGEETVSIATAPLASPAPLEGTARTHESHRDEATIRSAEVHVQAGTGAQVFLMSRYWTAPSRALSDHPEHPGRGLSLRNARGRVVVDYERDSVLGQDPPIDPTASCTVALDPGTYYLHRSLGDAEVIQSIVASPGWQTQIFVLKDPVRAIAPAPGEDEDLAQQRLLRPDAVTVLMCRGAFDPVRIDMETAEVARLALMDERRIMSSQLSQMLDGKFDNPMLGIFGGHLLLLSIDRSARDAKPTGRAQPPLEVQADFLDVVVRNLRGLVGSDHPDVEALSLRCTDRRLRTRTPLGAPPMLRRSWSLFVAASNDRPELVPRSLWTRVRQFVDAPPYFTWRRAAATVRDPATVMARSVERLRGRDQAVRRRRTMPAAPTQGIVAGHRMAMGRSMLIGPAGGPSATPALSSEDLREMSLANDIPRAAVDDAFGRS